jgi:hypothetical protein
MKEIPFTTHYEDLTMCDLCGHHTHGRVYEDQPDVVWCDSCHRPLIGNPTPDMLEFDDGAYCAPI